VFEMRTKLSIVVIFIVGVLLAACASRATEETSMNGRVLLWHDWQGPETQTLNNLIEKFTELHPDVEVISLPVSADTMVNRFDDRNASGLGPDLILLNADSVFELAESGLIDDISGQIDLEDGQYLSSALVTLQDGERLFGLPFSMHSQILYYNKELVESPPESLAELQDRVTADEDIALDTNLFNAIWGLGVFGGSIFDDEGRLTLHQGGLVNWLDFLGQAQATPGFTLDSDTERLRDLFTSGEAAYYVGPSHELLALEEALGEKAIAQEISAEETEEKDTEAAGAPVADPTEKGAEILGVASLPVGPNRWQPSPILYVDAFVFSRESSSRDRALALELARFLTNPQQQSRLAVEGIGRVPASAQVRINQNLPESTVALARQIGTAMNIPLGLRQVWNELVNEDGEFIAGYNQVLQGLVPANQFVDQSVKQINSELGVETAETDLAILCPKQVGDETNTLTIWHSMPESESTALVEIGRNFEAFCSGIHLEITSMEPEEIIDRYVEEVQAGVGPDILLESSRWTSQLAEGDLIADLSDYIRSEDLEPFIPGAPASMRYQRRTYGIPESISVLALLYNQELVENPPVGLEGLLFQVDPENRWALPMRFFYGYWGLNPFGGFEFNSDEAQIEEDAGLVPWLDWLQSTQNQPGVDLTFDSTEATDTFASGDAAFLVAGPWVLPQLRQALGEDVFGVTSLPSGPLSPGSPILQVQGVMVNANSSDQLADTAVAFARYLILPESQALFLITGDHVPAIVNIDLEEDPLLNGFHEQAKLAAVVDENSNFAAMEALGDELYEEVLLDGLDPAEAVQNFETAVQDIRNSQ